MAAAAPAQGAQASGDAVQPCRGVVGKRPTKYERRVGGAAVQAGIEGGEAARRA